MHRWESVRLPWALAQLRKVVARGQALHAWWKEIREEIWCRNEWQQAEEKSWRGRQNSVLFMSRSVWWGFYIWKEPDAEHVPAIGYIFQEKAPWPAPHHGSAVGLSGGTCSGHPLSTYNCWAAMEGKPTEVVLGDELKDSIKGNICQCKALLN